MRLKFDVLRLLVTTQKGIMNPLKTPLEARENAFDMRQINSKKTMKLVDVPICNEPMLKLGVFWSREKLSRRASDRLEHLLLHFDEKRIANLLIPSITGTAFVSLRLLDYCTIHYARQNNITILNKGTNNVLSIYGEYRSWLKLWKRPLFDAFRRGARIYFTHDNQEFSTTVAQLNYLYFAEISGVLNYVKNNYKTVEKHMQSAIKKQKLLKKRKVTEKNIKQQALIFENQHHVRF